MPFPQSTRVIYKNNPLENVICQIRFPAILKIDSEIPAEFQEKIRNQYPNFREKTEILLGQREIVGAGVALEMIDEFMKGPAIKNYEFASENEIWRINLTRTFVALSTKKYTKWEDFRERLNKILEYFIRIYCPNNFTRIGIRYIDIISRNKLKINGEKWSDLIQPYIIGILGDENIGEYVEEYEGKYEIKLDDNKSMVRILLRLIEKGDENEKNFMIDSDLFNDKKTETGDFTEKLEYLHQRSSRLIRWCIKDKLHFAMEPEEI